MLFGWIVCNELASVHLVVQIYTFNIRLLTYEWRVQFNFLSRSDHSRYHPVVQIGKKQDSKRIDFFACFSLDRYYVIDCCYHSNEHWQWWIEFLDEPK